MKRFIVTVVIAILFSGAALAQTNVVSSVNVVGYNQVTLPSNTYVMISVDFDRGTNNTLTSLFGALPNTSKVFVWNAGAQNYTTYLRGLTGFGAAGTNRIPLGSGCFVLLGPTAAARDIYISGDVPTNQVVSISRVPGYNMLSYPYPAVDVAITNTAVGKSAVNGNKIYFWNGTGYNSFLRGLTGWGAGGSNVIKVGQAYFFQGATSVTTNETKPYTLN